MKSFDDWYSELISDAIWLENMVIIHKDKSVRDAAQLVFGEIVSDSEKYRLTEMSEFRRWVHNKLAKTVYVKPTGRLETNYQTPEKKVDDVNVNPLETEEQRKEVDKLLNDYRRRLKESKGPEVKFNHGHLVPPITKEEAEAEGQVRPKATKHPYTPWEILEQHDLHNQWIRECFDTLTGKPNSKFIEKEEWLKRREKKKKAKVK